MNKNFFRTGYFIRLIISLSIIIVASFPLMVTELSTAILVSPWFGVILTVQDSQIFPGLDLTSGLWPVLLGIAWVFVIVIAARWIWTFALVTLFFLFNILLLYALLSVDLGHA